MASCHSLSRDVALASSIFGITRSLPFVDEDDVQSPGAVRTELDALFNIPSPRRTGDEIDRPRHSAANPQPFPTILIGGDHLIAAHHHNMGVGRKFSVVGVRGPEISIKVPVSAIAAKHGVRLTASPASARPRRMRSKGRALQGTLIEARSGARTSSAGRFSAAR